MPDAAPAAPVTPAAPKPNGATPVTPQPPAQPGGANAAPEYAWEGVVDGQKVRYTKAELDRYVSKAGFADKTVRQAKEALKSAKQLADERAKEKERLKKETEAYLRENEVDVEAFARSLLERKVAEARMSPEQKEIAERKAENEQLKAALEEKKNAETQQQQQAAAEQLQKRIETELSAAAKRAGIEADAESFYAIYEAFKEAVELDLPWDPDRIVEVAQQSMNGAQSKLEAAVLKGLSGEPLLKRLGPAVVKAVLAARMEQIRGKPAGETKPAVTEATPKKSGDYLTPAQAEEAIRKLGRR